MQRFNVFDYREGARRRLARIAYDYLEEHAEDGATLRRNRDALSRIALVPRVLTGVDTVSLSTELFGAKLSMPIIIGPTGNASLFWGDGDLALARAGAACGVPFVLSTNASNSLEEVAPVAGPSLRWFQLYALRENRATDDLVRRARDTGYGALVFTVDTAVAGKREASLRHGSRIPMKPSLRLLLDALSHPRWAIQMLRHGSPRWANLPPRDPHQGPAFSFNATFKRAIGWPDVERIRALWPGPLVLKGVHAPADVAEAAARGVEGVVLSNHGGRQLEGACAPIERLAEAVAVAGSKVTVMIDSGFRRGGEVIKALALGAKAVWLGRAPLYGLATSGEAGVRAVLEIFRDEMSRTMMLLGAGSLAELGPHHVELT